MPLQLLPCLLLPLLLLPVASLEAQELRAEPFMQRLATARDHLHSLEYDAARQGFAALAADYPWHPGAQLDLAITIWQEELFRRSDLALDRFMAPEHFAEPAALLTSDPIRRAFRAHVDSALQLTQAILARDPDHLDARYVLGACHGILAGFAISIDHDRPTAFEHGNEAYGIHKKIIDAHPDCADAYMTVGFYEYLIDNIPWYIKWLAVIIGYRGSEERGFSYLERAARDGQLVAREAKVMLMVLYLREARYEESLALARELHARHPRNFLLHRASAQILELMEEPEQATEVMEEVVRRAAAGEPNYQLASLPQLRVELAAGLRKTGHLERAAEVTGAALADSTASNVERAEAHLELGRILDLRGRREEARSHYELVLALEQDGDQRKQARKGLDEPFRGDSQ